MGITKNQRFRLKNEGYSDDALNAMDFEKASELIGKLPAFHKEVKYPKTEKVEYQGTKSYSKFDSVSAYTSYAKDLCITMLTMHMEARKIDNKIEPIEVGALMTEAIMQIKKAKETFEAWK